MNIAIVGFSVNDLFVSCFDSLYKFINEGFNVYLIFPKKKSTKKNEIEFLEKASEKIGISKIEYLEKFDFSTITQDNVKSLRDLIMKHNPHIVIIPFNESNNSCMRNLGASSILASREIKNIFMYETEKNLQYKPNLFSNIKKNNSIKKSCIKEFIKNNGEKSFLMKKLIFIHNTYVKPKLIKNAEPFESLRIVLEKNLF